MNDLKELLASFGADLDAFRSFDEDGPGLLPYASLLTARQRAGDVLDAVVGVYECQGEPLMFLADAALLPPGGRAANKLRRLLAMRGDAPYLGLVAPGRLNVYRIDLDERSEAAARVETASRDPSEQELFGRLTSRRMGAARRHWIGRVVLNLLDRALTDMMETHGVEADDAVSLVGRALFTRFLADRDLISTCPGAGDGEHLLFDGPERSAETCAWLDGTFNGDFLPLSDGIFASLTDAAYKPLGDILHRAVGGQLSLGWRERWDYLDFAHIPVGVLSQAYERYLAKHRPAQQRTEGGYYTPRPIADMMVHAAFEALAREGDAAAARTLDPAAGAGVFLITIFRRLVAERWAADGVRPDTRVLRDILYDQVRGFDVNEAALRLSALGLYLASIELDAEPLPVRKLAFSRNLRGLVLHKVGAQGADGGSGPGSLGPSIGQEHLGAYDLVIGNPPWTSATKLAGWSDVLRIVARVAAGRGAPAAPPIPNENLDLPFIWRAMEWARPDGQLAFALHARLLFQQGDGMPAARAAIFSCLDVTGVVNGTELRDTNVWPEVRAPFCLMFARNRPPPPGSSFRFVTPRLEDALNRAGTMRIDADGAELVMSDEVRTRPELLKILFRGGREDLSLFDRIMEADRGLTTVAGLMAGLPKPADGRKRSGNGYQALRPSSQAADEGAGSGQNASHLNGLPELTAAAPHTIEINASRLSSFKTNRLHRARERSIYTGPLLVVRKSPPAGQARIPVSVSLGDVVFSETFYGYSARGTPDADRLVRYMALVIGSRPALWLALLTSGEFGFEREVVEKSTVDDLPLPGFDDLAADDKDRIDPLFRSVAADSGTGAWDEVDSWVARLYGLAERDLQVVKDTLEYNLPFAANRAMAQRPPSRQAIINFCAILGEELDPWMQEAGLRASVLPAERGEHSPWRGVAVTSAGDDATPDRAAATNWTGLLGVADRFAATEVMFEDTAADTLWVGRLAQARYWSATQARLVARRIVWDHLDLLTGREA